MQEIIRYKCNNCGEIIELKYTPPSEMPKNNIKVSGAPKCEKCGSEDFTELDRRPK